MHLKRDYVDKSWPIPRKGTKYLVVPSHSRNKGVPLLVLMREVLGFVKTRKELKKIINEEKILVNGKIAKEDKLSLLLFDVLELPLLNKFYRVSLGENKKFGLLEINEEDKDKKVSKIIGKKILKGKKIQINLVDGQNFIFHDSVKLGDSVIIDLKNKKVSKIIPVKEKCKVLVIKGKHVGKIGEIKKIEDWGITIEINKESLMIKNKDIIVIE
jgi:small subunit ribosomal protein S4e